jgi:hypothetical protein
MQRQMLPTSRWNVSLESISFLEVCHYPLVKQGSVDSSIRLPSVLSATPLAPHAVSHTIPDPQRLHQGLVGLVRCAQLSRHLGQVFIHVSQGPEGAPGSSRRHACKAWTVDAEVNMCV